MGLPKVSLISIRGVGLSSGQLVLSPLKAVGNIARPYVISEDPTDLEIHCY